MRYENLESMIVSWKLFLSKVKDHKSDFAREQIMIMELTNFCRDRIESIQKAVNNGIEEYSNGNAAAENGVKYPTYIEYISDLKNNSKYKQLAIKLKEMSHDAADVISRLELELKEARETADHLRTINNKYFAQNMKLTEELMIIKGEASAEGFERY